MDSIDFLFLLYVCIAIWVYRYVDLKCPGLGGLPVVAGITLAVPLVLPVFGVSLLGNRADARFWLVLYAVACFFMVSVLVVTGKATRGWVVLFRGLLLMLLAPLLLGAVLFVDMAGWPDLGDSDTVLAGVVVLTVLLPVVLSLGWARYRGP